MRENRILISIDRSVSEVFEFTTNPDNTHLWIPQIGIEVCREYPPKIGTEYRNRGKTGGWDVYVVDEFERNKIFTLTDSERNYFVRYSYVQLKDVQTSMEYFEWMKRGELENPFPQSILEGLKRVMESRH